MREVHVDSVFWVHLSLFVDIISHHYKLKAGHMRLEKLRTPVYFDFYFVFEERHVDEEVHRKYTEKKRYFKGIGNFYRMLKGHLR